MRHPLGFVLSCLVLSILTAPIFGATAGTITCSDTTDVVALTSPESPLSENFQPESSRIMENLSCGQTVAILDMENGYFKISLGGKRIGYVDARHVRSIAQSLVGQKTNDYPAYEFFGGYNYVRLLQDDDNYDYTADSLTYFTAAFKYMQGWNASFLYNLNDSFGIKGEVSSIGNRQQESSYDTEQNKIENFSDTTKGYIFMAGPQITGRYNRVNLFAHVLVGAAHLNNELEYTNYENEKYNYIEKISRNAFALALGGGVDWNLGRHWAIRAPQLDYFPWMADDINDNTRHRDTFHNLRLSGGIVFRR